MRRYPLQEKIGQPELLSADFGNGFNGCLAQASVPVRVFQERILVQAHQFNQFQKSVDSGVEVHKNNWLQHIKHGRQEQRHKAHATGPVFIAP